LGDFPANNIAIGASGESTVYANANQELEEQNGCEGLNTVCKNNGENALIIFTGGSSNVNSVSDQTIDTENDCKAGAQCTTDLGNSFTLEAQDRNVNSNIKQTGKANNSCEGKGTTCSADAINTVNIVGGTGAAPISTEHSTTVSNTAEESNSGEYTVKQNSAQENECTGESTTCSTTAENAVNIDSSSSGSHDIDQGTDKQM
jgi:hypothetical protein